jgi:hypothetical protein
MADAGDATTSALLGALAHVSQLLIDKAAQLRRQPEMSAVTHELSIDGPIPDEQLHESVRETIQEARRRGSRQIVLSGYVDAKPRGHHGAAWTFHITDLGTAGWQLSRQVILYPLSGEDVERRMPDTDFPNWREVAAALPGLVEELVTAPLPTLAGE